MEERSSQPNQLEGPDTITEKAPSQPPQAPSDGEAPALFFSDDDESDDEGEFEFEFPFVSRDSPSGTAAPADELFADGRIRPFYYPVFGHGVFLGGHDGTAAQPAAPAAPPPRVRGQLGRLFLEESRARNSAISSTASTASSSSAATDDDGGGGGLEGASPESYCLWTPGYAGSPRPPRKSGSTGSMARWRRISKLVVGRSHSDGKEKFMFFAAPQPNKEAVNNKHQDKPKAKPSPAASGVRKQAPAVVDTVAAAHRIAYGGGVPVGTPRRTFLPYREELVGFFANVNGISRSHQHPF